MAELQIIFARNFELITKGKGVTFQWRMMINTTSVENDDKYLTNNGTYRIMCLLMQFIEKEEMLLFIVKFLSHMNDFNLIMTKQQANLDGRSYCKTYCLLF